MKFRLFLEEYKQQQKKDYDCGVASVVSVLKFFNIEYKDYLDVQDKLKTDKNTGTLPEDITAVLKKYDLTVKETFGKVGILLVNVNEFYKDEKDHSEDDQNGHWVFYKNQPNDGTDEGIRIYDVWNDKTTLININDTKKFTKNIKVKDKTFNDVVFSISSSK